MTSAADVREMVVKPRWYSHGLNRLEYYRLVAGAAAFLPRPARLAAARARERRLPAEWRAVRGNLARVLPAATPRELEQAVSDTVANVGAFFTDLLIVMVAAFENAVRAHPTQWFNFFNAWAPPVAAI